MLREAVVVAALAAACGDNSPARPDAATHRDVTVFRAVPNHDLDLVFVIDDTELDKQTFLKAKIGVLHDMFATLDPPGYDVHIGVISSDMGTVGSLDSTTPAPGIGSGPGSCSGFGKDGALLTNNTTLVTGKFVAERLDSTGTLTTNYSTTFEQAMAAILSLGASGCGFEQPLAAARRALSNPTNAGFLRASANLAIIYFQDEDDCSVRDAMTFFSGQTSLLGPLQSFRCTRWGLECKEDINSVGRKTGCHPARSSPYIEDVMPFVHAFLAVKPDPRMLAITGIFGDPEPIDVELRTPGGGAPILALAHSCAYNGSHGPEVADPGKRMEFFLDAFPSQVSTVAQSICTQQDYGPALAIIATAIKKTLGDTCIDTRSLRDTDAATDGVQPSCIVEDVRDSDPTPVAVPFELVVDDRVCPYYPEHLRVVLHRDAEPAADAWTHVRCERAN